MKVLLIILIVLVAIHLCVNIYSRFFDLNANKESACVISMMEESVKQYVENTRVLNKKLEDTNDLLMKKHEELNKLTTMYNTLVHHLPNIVQKTAMKDLVSRQPEDDECARIVDEYLSWLSLIKYDDETDHTTTDR